MPDPPQRHQQHRNIAERIKRRGEIIQYHHVQTSARLLGVPDLATWVTEGDRNDQVADIEDCVEDVEGLEDPVEAVAVAGAENAEDEENDADFDEGGGGGVEDVEVVDELKVDGRLVRVGKEGSEGWSVREER